MLLKIDVSALVAYAPAIVRVAIDLKRQVIWGG
jgi:hypothetical protein